MAADTLAARFERDGVALPFDVMSPEDAADWLRRFDANEARWSTAPELRRPYNDYRRANFHIVSRDAASLAAHPSVVDLVEPILGPDVLCWMVELFFKAPRSEQVVSFHQDLTYWGFDTDDLVTVWLALDDVEEANGAMKVVRGSHRSGQLDHHDTFASNNLLSRGQQVGAPHDPRDEVAIELRAGQASVHHGHAIHGSGANTTDRRRCGVVLRYVSPRMRPAVHDHDYGLLVRGVNRTQHLRTLAPPAQDFSPAALDLFEEVTAAQATALGEGAEESLAYDRPLGGHA